LSKYIFLAPESPDYLVHDSKQALVKAFVLFWYVEFIVNSLGLRQIFQDTMQNKHKALYEFKAISVDLGVAILVKFVNFFYFCLINKVLVENFILEFPVPQGYHDFVVLSDLLNNMRIAEIINKFGYLHVLFKIVLLLLL